MPAWARRPVPNLCREEGGDEAWRIYTFGMCCVVVVMIVSLIAGEIGG